jgi:hypothetical protein
MCLTGVDYFSTLGYQPGIAAVAAGLLSPIATLVLVLVTLLGALPVYRRVASESHNGEGSIAMLERLLPWWGGKLFVLVLLGFAATDFTITITLSAADATAHAMENPFAPAWFADARLPLTLGLVGVLAAVFLRGFTEAINIAVVLVGVYLAANVIVIGVSLGHIARDSTFATDWWANLTTQHGNPLVMVGIALLVFPKLALGLSGFETGVAVMPQIAGDPSDTDDAPAGRIRGTKRLLTTAAITMSGFLITSSLVTTLLIPAAEFRSGGAANGRALAYLAHEYLGEVFGTFYDISTICILWFAGASAMAGLLNLVPRFLPRFGMAPHWAAAMRPLVVVFSVIAIVVTIYFDADVNAQGAAYATGVLVLMTSASVAVFLSAYRRHRRAQSIAFAVIAVAFTYTTIVNIVERPDGVRIAALFIVGIVVVSIVSRLNRAFQIRATSTALDSVAADFVHEAATGHTSIRIIPIPPGGSSASHYRQKLAEERRGHGMPARAPALFLEVHETDSSDFEEALLVHGCRAHGYRILSVASNNVPATIAAVLLTIRDTTGVVPDVFFEWSDNGPVKSLFRYLISGVGLTANVTREVVRRAESDPTRRPSIHVS